MRRPRVADGRMAAQSEESEVEALRARVAALETRCAELEGANVIEPYVAATVRLEAQCADLRERCGALERENATLSLSLAYFHTQSADEVETLASAAPRPPPHTRNDHDVTHDRSEPTPQKSKIEWGEEITPERLDAATGDPDAFDALLRSP